MEDEKRKNNLKINRYRCDTACFFGRSNWVKKVTKIERTKLGEREVIRTSKHALLCLHALESISITVREQKQRILKSSTICTDFLRHGRDIDLKKKKLGDYYWQSCADSTIWKVIIHLSPHAMITSSIFY